jgi:hypothetical protein
MIETIYFNVLRSYLKINLILSALVKTQDNYGKIIGKLYNYFATIAGLRHRVAQRAPGLASCRSYSGESTRLYP